MANEVFEAAQRQPHRIPLRHTEKLKKQKHKGFVSKHNQYRKKSDEERALSVRGKRNWRVLKYFI